MGVPRSGTSAVAGVLHHLGVDMGDSIPTNYDWNEKGYYQDKHFERAISNLLRYPFPKFNGFVDCPKITELARVRTGLWGIKSNRMVYCLPSLLAGVDECKIITTSRPVEESISSYAERLQADSSYSELQITNIADAISQGITNPDLVVPFHGLLDNTTEWVAKIAEIVGLPVTQEAIDYIDISLRRFP